MKTKYTLSLALLLGTALSVHAQVAAGVNDLILGFTNGSGSNSLEIDLGNINQFTGASASGISGTLSLGNFNSLLSTAYGASWSTTPTVTWAVAGGAGSFAAATNGQPVKTLWVTSHWTSASGNLGEQNSTVFGNVGSSVAGTFQSNVGKVYNGLSFANASQTVASNAVQLPSGGNAWVTVAGTGQSAFSTSGLTNTTFINHPTSVIGSTTYSASDLYSISPINAATSTNTFMGTFALATSGAFTFTGKIAATAVPEPSTYAAILGAAGLGLVLLRRRKLAAPVAA